MSKPLTIVIEHDRSGVNFDGFLAIAGNTVRILRGLDRAASKDNKNTAEWKIRKASMNSPFHLTIEPHQISSKIPLNDSLSPFIEDLRRLESGQGAKHMSLEMLRQSKKIVGALNGSISAISFITDDDEVRVTQRLAASADETLKSDEEYYEVGSVEGTLELINVHGVEQIKVWDTRYKTPVTCVVSSTQIEDAKEYLKKRVIIRGLIAHKDGVPKSIEDVFDVRCLPDDESLPKPETISPIDLCGDIDPVDYLRGPDVE